MTPVLALSDFSTIISLFLTLFRMGFSEAAHGWGERGAEFFSKKFRPP